MYERLAIAAHRITSIENAPIAYSIWNKKHSELECGFRSFQALI